MKSEVSLVDLANEDVSIYEALRVIGSDAIYAEYGGKQYCPFGDLRHADGGLSKAFRVYFESNSCFCFAGCGYYNPVKLVQEAMDMSAQEAAEMLLLRAGWVPETYETRWQQLQENTEKIDTGALAEALKTYCSRFDPDWEFSQLGGTIAKTLDKCLGLLAKVSTTEDATTWLTQTKQVMKHTIEREQHRV